MGNYRGRLIWPCLATISRINTPSTEANAIGGQPRGYDRVWREPVETSEGEDSRVYFPPDVVQCQVRSEFGAYDKEDPYPDGRRLQYQLKIILHYKELEHKQLIGPDGGSVFQPSDRLDFVHRTNGQLLKDFTKSPLYCIQAQDRSFGLDGLNRNLLMLYFDDRLRGYRIL